MADYIPFEIQAEIMKRLPTNSLMQFRSVSKRWKSLIDSSKFINDYSINHTQKQQHLLVSHRVSYNSEQKYVLFVDYDTFPLKKFLLPPSTFDCNFPRILGSSNGLFCLYTHIDDPIEDVRKIKSVVVWNPSIRKSVAIDVPDSIEPRSYIDIGFGVCPHTRDPKIVKIEYGYNLSHFVVYTFSSRAWRSIPVINQFSQSINYIWEMQVVIDGFICWLVFSRTMTPESHNLIVLFDITSEKFVEVSLPNTLARTQNHIFISKLQESLVVIEVVEEAEKEFYDVWMMETGAPNTFTKFFTINMPEASLQARFLGFRKNNEPIFYLKRTDSDTDDLVVTEVNYDHRNQIAISWKGIYFAAMFYTETLLLHDY